MTRAVVPANVQLARQRRLSLSLALPLPASSTLPGTSLPNTTTTATKDAAAAAADKTLDKGARGETAASKDELLGRPPPGSLPPPPPPPPPRRLRQASSSSSLSLKAASRFLELRYPRDFARLRLPLSAEDEAPGPGPGFACTDAWRPLKSTTPPMPPPPPLTAAEATADTAATDTAAGDTAAGDAIAGNARKRQKVENKGAGGSEEEGQLSDDDDDDADASNVIGNDDDDDGGGGGGGGEGAGLKEDVEGSATPPRPPMGGEGALSVVGVEVEVEEKSNSPSSSSPLPLSSPPFVWSLFKEKDKAELIHLVGVDCEMCYTSAGGLELTRCTFIQFDGKTVYDRLVLPSNPITDYNTAFSGVTKELMDSGPTRTLREVHQELRDLGIVVGGETVLVGHSIESDLKALKLVHKRVVDTATLYPHPKGLPFKMGLRALALSVLKRVIQQGDGTSGHDSAQDALAAMDLTLAKLKSMHTSTSSDDDDDDDDDGTIAVGEIDGGDGHEDGKEEHVGDGSFGVPLTPFPSSATSTSTLASASASHQELIWDALAASSSSLDKRAEAEAKAEAKAGGGGGATRADVVGCAGGRQGRGDSTPLWTRFAADGYRREQDAVYHANAVSSSSSSSSSSSL
eukprot:CAMPEP_0171987772 /NCGR_PEP_ID=MMETSP0993-20121228/275558_1 /TAXON_ID=483369 /ORGANISM="non described non described, Strain CCMP2098" /LENGTH=629 /DNA_ID=CAMNT_0012640723 /DNA_START=44 /DNA_END=1931 /DNA_ORIENTATION=-